MWIAVLCFGLLLCGCTDGVDYDPELLEYSGLRWGMTFEEVQQVLGFSDGDTLETKLDELDPDRPQMPAWHRYTVENVQIFGFPTVLVELRFREYTGHAPGLAEMVAYFPDGYGGTAPTDVEELYRVLQEHYADRDGMIPSVMWNHHSGELEQVYAAVTENRSDGNGTLKHPTFEDFCRCQENPAVMLWMEAEQDEEEIARCHGNGLIGLRLFFDAELLVNFRAIDRYFEYNAPCWPPSRMWPSVFPEKKKPMLLQGLYNSFAGLSKMAETGVFGAVFSAHPVAGILLTWGHFSVMIALQQCADGDGIPCVNDFRIKDGSCFES